MSLQALLGTDTLLGKSGPVNTSTIEGKSLLLYFSAHWCGPCRQFTPMLSKFYKELKAKRDDFEVVFISADRTQAEFESYYDEHPWMTLPFGGPGEKKNRDKLNSKFKVRGIPSLVVVDKDGKTATTDGVKFVQMDPQGKDFPWIPKSIYELLGETKMLTKDGNPLTVDDLKKTDAFALYFSASWCPPCRAFTPLLSSTYKKIQAAGSKTEFLYVPGDRDQDSYKDYYATMPFASVALGEKSTTGLKQVCEVSGIPTLVTCKGSDGSIINNSARAAAAADPDGAEFPWEKKPLPVCGAFDPSNDAVVDAINENACVILSLNNAANKETAKIEFTKAAEKYHATKSEKDDYPIQFFISDSPMGAELYGRVLKALGAAAPREGTATVMTLHLSNNRAKSTLSGEISAAAVLEHVVEFKNAHA